MKKLASLLIAVFCMMQASAQTYCSFPDSGAVWSVLIESGNPTVPYQAAYVTYTLGSDTIIGAYSYKKLTPNGQWPERGAIREDTVNHRIYFAGTCMTNYQDTLIYDFDLVVGDTAYTDLSGETYIVIDIDSILILNQYRKRIQMGSQFGGSDEWIVGIGSTNHPLKPLLPMEFEGNYTLMCLQDDTDGIYIRYTVVSNNTPWYTWLHPGNCGLLNVNPPYSTFPSVEVTVENGILDVHALLFNSQCTYTIFDINGRKIIRQDGFNSAQIPLSNCSNGIYILQVTDPVGHSFTQKFALY